MAAQFKPDPEQPPEPWYRTPAAVSTAGVVGIALVGGLVFTVVKMSDQWSQPPTMSTVLTTVPTTQQTLRTTTPFIVTPSSTDTSTFPTSVQLSTTDIGVPGETTTTTTDSSETSPGESPTTRRTPRTQEDDGDQTTTTRKRPRLNQTRTLSP
ncbi:MAG: hypothetical protein ABWY45_18115 [Mycobacterium sp.]